MGLLLLALLGAALLAGLVWAARPSPRARVALLAAVLAGGLGYVAQGSPFLPGAPAGARTAPPPADPLFAAERLLWLGRVGPDADALSGADMLIAGGSPDYAIGILRGAVARAPRDMALWIGLGHALASQAGGRVTPAARFCFERAAAVAPGNPAPGYFLGLAYLTAGDLDTAERTWRALLPGLSADGGPRRLLERRLATLERLRAPAR